jgi:hypothetical protein
VEIDVGYTGSTSKSTTTIASQISSSSEPLILAKGGSNLVLLQMAQATISTHSLKFNGITNLNLANELDISGYSVTTSATADNYYFVTEGATPATNQVIRSANGTTPATTVDDLVGIVKFITGPHRDFLNVTEKAPGAPAGILLIDGTGSPNSGLKVQAFGGGDTKDVVKVGSFGSGDPIQVRNLALIQMFAGPEGSWLENDTAIDSLLVGPYSGSSPTSHSTMKGGKGSNVFVEDHVAGGAALMESLPGSASNVFFSGYSYNQATGVIIQQPKSSEYFNTIRSQGNLDYVFSDVADKVFAGANTNTNGEGYVTPLAWLQIRHFTTGDFEKFFDALIANGIVTMKQPYVQSFNQYMTH